MKFVVEDKVFEKVPDMYIGVVAAKGIDNAGDYPEIGALLAAAEELAMNIRFKEYRADRKSILRIREIK